MAFKLRKLISNDQASGLGAILILVPFIISIILLMVFMPLGETQSVAGVIIYEPENYGEMTRAERESWLTWQYGGTPTKEWRADLQFWLVFPYIGEWYMVYPDGTEFIHKEWENFVEGTTGDVDYVRVVQQTINLDPPALQHIGVFGILIRVIMILSVCLGLVDLLWFG